MALSEDEARPLFHQLLSAISYAHNQHICHRDLKLENILLKGPGDTSQVKIADFGLSDFYRPGAMMKSNCGTLSFLAPEVFRGTSNAGPPLDVWSLGVILFAVLCGRLPFEPGTESKDQKRTREQMIRSRIMKCQFKIDDNIGPEAKDLVRRMLKLDPAERASIPELLGHCWLRTGIGIEFKDSIPPSLRNNRNKDSLVGADKTDNNNVHDNISSSSGTGNGNSNSNSNSNNSISGNGNSTSSLEKTRGRSKDDGVAAVDSLSSVEIDAISQLSIEVENLKAERGSSKSPYHDVEKAAMGLGPVDSLDSINTSSNFLEFESLDGATSLQSPSSSMSPGVNDSIESQTFKLIPLRRSTSINSGLGSPPLNSPGLIVNNGFSNSSSTSSFGYASPPPTPLSAVGSLESPLSKKKTLTTAAASSLRTRSELRDNDDYDNDGNLPNPVKSFTSGSSSTKNKGRQIKSGKF
jgi:serine/threonine protein kinase